MLGGVGGGGRGVIGGGVNYGRSGMEPSHVEAKQLNTVFIDIRQSLKLTSL